jgi:hypothetical protein
MHFAALASGTRPFRHIELSGRQRLAVWAAVVLALWGFSSQYLPALPETINAMCSAAVTLVLITLIVWGLASLDDLGHSLLLVAAVVLPFTMLMVAFEAIPFANVLKVVLAGVIGTWLVQLFVSVRWIVLAAVAVSVADVFSVAAGPTRVMLNHTPDVVSGFTVAMAWFGYAPDRLSSAIGVSDVVFLALFLGAARRFQLREKPTAVAIVVSILITLAAALWWKALPALPMMSLAFIAVNCDLFAEAPLLAPGERAAARDGAEAGCKVLAPAPVLDEHSRH